MSTMYLAIMLAAGAAALLAAVVVMKLQQDEHRRTGLLPGADPRTRTAALLNAVVGAAPILRVRRGGVSFEDGSGLLLSEPEPEALDALGRLVAKGQVYLDRVYELTKGWRLVFRSGSRIALVDVQAWRIVAPA